MHGELGEPQIYGGNSRLRQTDAAEGAAARHIRTVVKALIFYTRVAEQFSDCGYRQRVARVCAVCVRLDDNPAAHNGAVGRVAFFGAVGVKRVRVVQRDEHGCGKRLHKFFFRFSCIQRNAFERGSHKVASRALPRARADFFVVEEGGDADSARLLCDRVEGGADARQIVETGRREKFVVRAAEKGFFRRNNVKIAGDGIIAQLRFAERIEGQKIGLRIGCELFIRLSVHMNGERGNDEGLL